MYRVLNCSGRVLERARAFADEWLPQASPFGARLVAYVADPPGEPVEAADSIAALIASCDRCFADRAGEKPLVIALKYRADGERDRRANPIVIVWSD